jgi:hypothetical protein
MLLVNQAVCGKKIFLQCFYLRWESISELRFEDYGDGPYTGPKYAGQSDIELKSTFDDEFLLGLNGNLNATLTVTVSFKMKVTGSSIKSVTLGLADGNTSSAETYDANTVSISTYDEYIVYNMTFESSAQVGKNGYVYFNFDKDRDGTGGNYYVKEFSIDVRFK